MPENLEFPSHWTEVQGLNIHYKCLGKGLPVILIYGNGNDWHEWQENLAFLAPSFHVYAPDMPGFGLSQSPNKPLSPAWSVSVLKDFMEAIGISAAHIIGHSLGGMVTPSFALAFPERVMKLALIDSIGFGKID